jgi:hypothetical protein
MNLYLAGGPEEIVLNPISIRLTCFTFTLVTCSIGVGK